MKVAHVRERHGPAGRRGGSRPHSTRRRRRRLARPRGRPATGASLGSAARAQLGAAPAAASERSTTSWRAGLRVEALRELVDDFVARSDDDDALLDAGGLSVRTAGPAAAVAPRLLRVRGHVRTMWERRGGEVPGDLVPAAGLLLQQRVRDPRTGRSGLAPGGVVGARLRARGRGARRHARDRPRGRAGRGGDRRVHDLQRLVGARPPARGDRRSARVRPRARTSPARSGRIW